ncbi:hypothetical protein [Methylobacterium tardum]|uniref:hypothetical protein n=1 Tax=Methylobacterium tardum TaxID=374432 RepID=UPI00361ADE03
MTEDFGSRDEKGGASPFTDMIEATRLTGLGRLEEATALIQRSLAGQKAAPPPPPPPARTGPRPRAVPRRNPAPGCAR